MSEVSNWFQQSKKKWGVLAQTAVWVLGIIGSFLLPPPVGITQQSEKLWLRLAQFIIICVVGLMFIAARRWNRNKHILKWWVSSALILAVAIFSFFWYQRLLNSWTCKYYEQSRIVGSEPTNPHGVEYFRDNPGASCEDALKEHAGKAEDVWTKASIDSRQIILAGIYILCVPLFTICIIAVLQTIHIIEHEQEM
jgi:amino acid transporter